MSGLSLLIDGILRSVIQFPLQAGSALLNLKGRDPANNLGLVARDASSSLNHELLYIAGNYLCGDSNQPESLPYMLQAYTRFAEFPANGGILHTLDLQLEGHDLKTCSPKDLGRIFPLVPERVRLGLDLFSERVYFYGLGSTPIVNETLLIEADNKRVAVGIFVDLLKNPRELPLQQDRLYYRAKAALDSATKSSLFDDLENQMLRH